MKKITIEDVLHNENYKKHLGILSYLCVESEYMNRKPKRIRHKYLSLLFVENPRGTIKTDDFLKYHKILFIPTGESVNVPEVPNNWKFKWESRLTEALEKLIELKLVKKEVKKKTKYYKVTPKGFIEYQKWNLHSLIDVKFFFINTPNEALLLSKKIEKVLMKK